MNATSPSKANISSHAAVYAARTAWRAALMAGKITDVTYRSGAIEGKAVVVRVKQTGMIKILYNGCSFDVSPYDLHDLSESTR